MAAISWPGSGPVTTPDANEASPPSCRRIYHLRPLRLRLLPAASLGGLAASEQHGQTAGGGTVPRGARRAAARGPHGQRHAVFSLAKGPEAASQRFQTRVRFAGRPTVALRVSGMDSVFQNKNVF